jgi:hypothetical protein
MTGMMHVFPCCPHCTHKACRCIPPCDFEGHPGACLQCADDAALAEVLDLKTLAAIQARQAAPGCGCPPGHCYQQPGCWLDAMIAEATS